MFGPHWKQEGEQNRRRSIKKKEKKQHKLLEETGRTKKNKGHKLSENKKREKENRSSSQKRKTNTTFLYIFNLFESLRVQVPPEKGNP